MADLQYQRLLHQVAETSRKASMADRVGTVHEVWRKDGVQKIRVQIGTRPNGSPWLSPWLYTEDHRGPHREQEKYHKGQTVKVAATNGDFRQATVGPYHENDKHKEPAHATDNEHTYQYGAQRGTQGKDWAETWLAEDGDAKDSSKALVRVRMGKASQTNQQSPQGQQSGSQSGRGDGPNADNPQPKGEYDVYAKEKVTISSDTEIVLKVGGAQIDITTSKIILKVGTAQVELDSGGNVWLNDPEHLKDPVADVGGSPIKQVYGKPA